MKNISDRLDAMTAAMNQFEDDLANGGKNNSVTGRQVAREIFILLEIVKIQERLDRIEDVVFDGSILIEKSEESDDEKIRKEVQY